MAKGVCGKGDLGVRLIRERKPNLSLCWVNSKQKNSGAPNLSIQTQQVEKEGQEETKAASFPGKGQSRGSLCSRSSISPKGGVSPADGKFHCIGTHKSWVWLFQQPDAQGENKAAGKGAI